ncbi:MAG: methionine--tRNA ligase [Dehalococcoidia bacterium]|nr:methionine--tRNA ligase [Dehalococcoidia bacterium]MCB9486880.1 methionine--tRNA ligase [Thermoflexaceae bacterium]
MSQRILVCVAWPYANYFLHVGQAAGAYLPADIFARYQRLVGSEVVMVSGSDSHGTPITVSADRDGVTPRDIVDRYHPKIVETWERLGIGFDLYTTTLTENHYQTTQEVFLRLLENGYLYEGTQEQLYDPEADRFLPDRYVEGTCPHCGYGEARGDQCDNCGKTLDATELKDPRSRLTGAIPVVRESTHYFLKLTALQGDLESWVRKQAHWRRNVLNFTLGWLTEGLKDRAITRDIAWGVPVPVDGYENKRIYVWFDAVIGYLSATREWAQKAGNPEAWRPFWEDPETRAYYFIGKDNIPFHTIIWPGMLLGYGGLNLPYDVPANQYVNFSAGQKQSKSKGTGTWVLDLLDRYDPDVVRFYLTSIMPETSDSEFREEEMVRANNEVLIATWGNLANRVLSMVHRNFEGVIPDHGPAAPESEAILQEAAAAFERVGSHYNACNFRDALNECLRLAQLANRYLDVRAPWKAVKQDRAHAAETLTTAVSVIGALRTLLHPVLPFSTQVLHEDLGQDGGVAAAGWEYAPIVPGTVLRGPRPLYAKLDPLEAVLAE